MDWIKGRRVCGQCAPRDQRGAAVIARDFMCRDWEFCLHPTWNTWGSYFSCMFTVVLDSLMCRGPLLPQPSFPGIIEYSSCF